MHECVGSVYNIYTTGNGILTICATVTVQCISCMANVNWLHSIQRDVPVGVHTYIAVMYFMLVLCFAVCLDMV